MIRSETHKTMPQSHQPALQSRWISRAVEDGSHINCVWLNRGTNTVFSKSLESDLMSGGRNEAKPSWRFQNLLKRCVYFNSKLTPQPGALFFIPIGCIFELQTGHRSEDDHAFHALRDFRRSFSSACTASQGIPRSGCCRSSSARRSNSVICSGESSSLKLPNSKSMVSTSSRRSASGIRRSSSRISALLMGQNFWRPICPQAGFSARTNSALRIPHSAFL